MSTVYERLATAVLEGNSEKVPGLVQKGLDKGMTAKELLDLSLIHI